MPTTYQARLRHAEYYETILRGLNEIYLLSGIMGSGLFDLERDNIQKAWSWIETHSPRDADAARLSISYPQVASELLDLRLPSVERIRWLQVGSNGARRLEDRRAEAQLLCDLGKAHAALGDANHAFHLFEESRRIARDARDREAEANSLTNLGAAYIESRKPLQAVKLLDLAIQIYHEIGVARGEADALDNLGVAYRDLDVAHNAIELHSKALAIYRQIDYYRGEANALNHLAIAYNRVGDDKRASDLLIESLVLAREIKDRQAEAKTLSDWSLALDSPENRGQTREK